MVDNVHDGDELVARNALELAELLPINLRPPVDDTAGLSAPLPWAKVPLFRRLKCPFIGTCCKRW